jgi:hypothetical protein
MPQIDTHACLHVGAEKGIAESAVPGDRCRLFRQYGASNRIDITGRLGDLSLPHFPSITKFDRYSNGLQCEQGGGGRNGKTLRLKDHRHFFETIYNHRTIKNQMETK